MKTKTPKVREIILDGVKMSEVMNFQTPKLVKTKGPKTVSLTVTGYEIWAMLLQMKRGDSLKICGENQDITFLLP